MGQEVVSAYEFVQAGEHKSHLLMNVLDMEALEAEMTSDAAKEWDKKIIVRILSMQLRLLNKNLSLTNTMSLSEIHIFLEYTK